MTAATRPKSARSSGVRAAKPSRRTQLSVQHQGLRRFRRPTRPRPASLAASAAPTMPALLINWATTSGVRFFSSGTHFSGFLEMPPPRMNSSGQSRFSTVRRYFDARLAHCSQLSPSRSRAEAAALALGVVPVQFDVAELGVRDQLAVVDQGDADAGAEGDHDDQPAAAAPRAVPGLGEPGGVGVVEHRHRSGQFRLHRVLAARCRSSPCRHWRRSSPRRASTTPGNATPNGPW